MIEKYFNTRLLTAATLATVTVLVLTHIPKAIMPPSLGEDGIDKIEHVVAYAVIAYLFLISLRGAPSVRWVLLLFVAVSLIGAFDELTQPFVNRTASVTDLAADVVGILSALILFAARRQQLPRPNV